MTSIDGLGAGSAFAAAQYGLQNASDGISQAASNIAQRTAEDAVAPAQPIATNTDTAKVLGVADEMLGTIIDVLA